MTIRLAALFAGASLILIAGSAGAAEPEAPRIAVTGEGHVTTPPDIAILSFTVHGEGTTADAATSELVRKRKAIEGSLGAAGAQKTAITTGDLTLSEARGRACDQDQDSSRPRLSKGDCAVQGYVADLAFTVRLEPADRAGTALSLAGRLGASNAKVSDFELRDPEDARRRSEAAAIANARIRAEAIAAASGVRLGSILDIRDAERDGEVSELMVTAARLSPAADVANAPPPIVVSLTPDPIKTDARVTVTWAIGK